MFKRFSERQGIQKPKTEIQVDTMDTALRNQLWNALSVYYWEPGYAPSLSRSEQPTQKADILRRRIWNFYFEAPLDTVPHGWFQTLKTIREYFFRCDWNEVYDFIEFVAYNYDDEYINEQFRQTCNNVLKTNLSAWHFVGKQLTKITSESEIAEIEEALSSPFMSVNTHLDNALKLMSDKKSPDYRNSIKESISAVEALCRIITGDKNANLGQALNTIERGSKIKLHGALKSGFSSLYGYTSTDQGIRHALLEEPTLDFEDAKFMLVSCSAFVNYLMVKASKAGLKLGKKIG
jgi:hypothetical protein